MLLLQMSQTSTLLGIFLFFFTIIGITFLVMYNQHMLKMKATIGQQNAHLTPVLNVQQHSSALEGLAEADVVSSLLGVKKKFTHTTNIEQGTFLNDPIIDEILKVFPDSTVEFQKDGISDSGMWDNKEASLDQVYSQVYLLIKYSGDKIIMKYSVSPETVTQDGINLPRRMHEIRIFHDKKTKFKLDELFKIIREHRYFRPAAPQTKKSFYIYQIVKRGLEYITNAVQSFTLIKGLEDLKTMYEDVTLTYNNEEHKIGLDVLAEGIIKAVQSKHNIYITGSVGTGKTVLGGYFCYELAHQNIGKVFYMNATSVADVITPEFAGSAANIFGTNNYNEVAPTPVKEGQVSEGYDIAEANNKQKEKQLNIIVIDEAQIALSAKNPNAQVLLAMLDGEHKRQYNTVYILIFNESQEDVIPAAFRSGRVDVNIHLTPLKKPTADKAMEKIKAGLNPANDIFDTKLYEHTLKTKNVLPGATEPYALENEITLADVHHCVVPVAIVDTLKEIIETKGKKVGPANPPQPAPQQRENIKPRAILKK